LAEGIGLSKEHTKEFIKIAHGLYQAFIDNDANLAEINPLVVTGENQLIALDGKMVVDDSALFRHAEIAEMAEPAEGDASEQAAREAGLSYINLDGEIGCMVNGAGLAMATMDIVKYYGGEPANFLDIGGGASADKVTEALRIILADEQVKSVLINIFGGITRCDDVARGFLDARKQIDTKLPFIIRLAGTNEKEGRAILAEGHVPNLITASSLSEAAQKAVAAAKGELVEGENA
jgi:succinyl-CoA synthetase beta subunit